MKTTHLKAPGPLPEVSAPKAQAVEFFRGWWAGISVGLVIGAGVAVVLA